MLRTASRLSPASRSYERGIRSCELGTFFIPHSEFPTPNSRSVRDGQGAEGCAKHRAKRSPKQPDRCIKCGGHAQILKLICLLFLIFQELTDSGGEAKMTRPKTLNSTTLLMCAKNVGTEAKSGRLLSLGFGKWHTQILLFDELLNNGAAVG